MGSPPHLLKLPTVPPQVRPPFPTSLIFSSLIFFELGFPVLQILFSQNFVSCSFQDKELKTSLSPTSAWAGQLPRTPQPWLSEPEFHFPPPFVAKLSALPDQL